MSTENTNADHQPAGLGAMTGSASPMTDDAWESYNRRACGLHYIAHKMRAMEIALREIIRLGDGLPDDAEEVRIAKAALCSQNDQRQATASTKL